MTLTPRLIIPASFAVLVLVLGGGGYFYFQSQKDQSVKGSATNTQTMVQKKDHDLVSEVGKLVDLPSGENPTIATITEVEKLKVQPLFAKAKNGDKVLIFTKAKKVIIYDPVAKKILDIAPISIGTQSAQSPLKTIQAKVQPRVVLRNGTTTTKLTVIISNKLRETIPDINVVKRENAKDDTHEETVVVIVNEIGQDLAQVIAKTLNAKIGELPAGELRPEDGDIVVIIGKDNSP